MRRTSDPNLAVLATSSNQTCFDVSCIRFKIEDYLQRILQNSI